MIPQIFYSSLRVGLSIDLSALGWKSKRVRGMLIIFVA